MPQPPGTAASTSEPDPSTDPSAGPVALPADPLDGVVATGLGSWPGTDVRETLRVVRGELAAGTAPDGVAALPYLPELPDRGPGADLVGRGAHLLVDLPVDLQPQGWRLVDRPGRDHERTASLWRQDLDELAEAFDGWTGPLKVQVPGPWTLAASLWLPLGDRVLADPGAVRDLTGSLAEGIAAHLRRVHALVPGANLVLQVDEPSIGAVLLGRIRSASGYRVLAAPERGEAVRALGEVLSAGAAAVPGMRTVVHSCAGDPPVDVLLEAGPDALALDVAQLDRRRWEQLAGPLEGGHRLWAGVDEGAPDPLLPVRRAWGELGLAPTLLGALGVTPPCGLAGRTPPEALAATRRCRELAARLAEDAAA